MNLMRMAKKTFRKILKNEYIFSIITRILVILISLIRSAVVARYLGAALKGTSAYINSVTSVGSIVITFGMHQAYPYFKKKFHSESFLQEYMSVIYILYAIYMILAVIISAFFIPSQELKAAVLLIPILGYSGTAAYVCLVESPNTRNKWWTIIGFIDLCFVSLLALFTQSNLNLAVLILLTEDLLKALIFTVILRIRPIFNKNMLPLTKELFKMGFFPMVALLMTTLNYKIDVFMLKANDIITEAEIGVYSIGVLWADRILLIPDTLKGVLVSRLSKNADESEVARVCRLCFCATVLICAFLLLFGKYIILLMYGSEYSGAYQVITVCSFGVLFVGHFKLIAQYNIINKKQIRNVALLSVSILVNVILNLLLIPRYRLTGAAFASGVGYFITGWVFTIWFARSNKIKVKDMYIPGKKDLLIMKKKLSRSDNK